MKIDDNKGIALYSFESPAFESVTTFVTTRHNSDGTASARGNFNLGLYCGDDNTQVERNLQQLCDALSIARHNLFYPRQVHGAKVLDINESFMALSHDEQTSRLDGVDALVTHLPHVAIAVTTADCVPVVLYDPVRQVVAAIHAGWRGTVQEIVRHTLLYMQQHYGTQVADIQAGIAPCIGVEAYEVGQEVVDALQQAGYDLDAIAMRNPATAQYHIDLATACADLLLRCGVLLHHIEVCGICTHRHSDTFYSVRALGSDTGRFLTGVMLRD